MYIQCAQEQIITDIELISSNLPIRMEHIKVSSRGKIVIPEEIRKRLCYDKGKKLVFYESHGTRIPYDAKMNEELLNEEKERQGWMMLVLEGAREVWDNPEDDIWNQYA